MHEIKSVDYAMTMTCKPVLFAKSLEQQFDTAEADIKARLNAIKGFTAKYTIICELTKSFNCHFHGVVSFQGYCKGPINFLRKLYDAFRGSKIIGHCFFKPVDNYHNWKDYIIKDIPDTYKTLHCRHPVIQNDYNILFSLNEADLVI